MSDGGRLELLLWLRFRMMFRGRGAGRKVAAILALVILVPLALWLGRQTYGMTEWLAGHEDPALLREWVHLLMLFVYVTLVVMPVIGFASSEFYDVTKLFHLPVSHRTVFVAQTIGLVFGSTTLFFLPALVGLLLGLPGGPGTFVFRLAVLLLFLFHAVALGQLFQLLLLNVLRSRRFRDLAIVLGALLSGAFYITFRLLAEAGNARQSIAAVLEREVSRFLIPVPSYWASSAIAPGAGVGHILLFAVVLLPLTALVVTISSTLQERAFHGEVRVSVKRTTARRDRRPGRTRFPLSAIPTGARALAAQELRLLSREPAVKATLIQQLVFFGFPLLFAIWRGGGDVLERPEGLLLGGCGAFLFVESFLALNMLGLDGPAIAHLLATPVSRRRVLLGKALAYLPLFLAANLLLQVVAFAVLSLLGGRFTASGVYRIALGSVSAVPVLLGIGAVFSVLAPARLGARSRRALAHGQSAGGGCAMALLRLLALFVLAVLLLPVAGLCLPSGVPLLPLLALPYAGAVLLVGILAGGRLMKGREEHLIGELARGAA